MTQNRTPLTHYYVETDPNKEPVRINLGDKAFVLPRPVSPAPHPSIDVFHCPTESYDDYVGTVWKQGHVTARGEHGVLYLLATPELLALLAASLGYKERLDALISVLEGMKTAEASADVKAQVADATDTVVHAREGLIRAVVAYAKTQP